MPASDIKFPLRLPVELDAELRKRAEAGGLSLNAMICVVLGKFAGEMLGGQDGDMRKSGRKVEQAQVQERKVQAVRGRAEKDAARGGQPEGEAEVGESAGESCRDCGREMILNPKMKRWECECGFQMKMAKEKR